MRFVALEDALHAVGYDEFDLAIELALNAKRAGKRFFFIGNGGSAAIASHMAADWLKTAGVPAMCFNDTPLMSAISNDERYEEVFRKPLALHCGDGDLLFAISSAGYSKSIRYGVHAAKLRKAYVITLSGFKPDNPLRALGDVNFYVPSDRYGVVEVAHHAICHSILDAVVNDS